MPKDDEFFDTSAAAMSGALSNSASALRQYIERAERLIEEKQGIADDLKDVFSEAKGQGFDVKTMRKIIALRALEKDARDEQDALLQSYRSAMGI